MSHDWLKFSEDVRVDDQVLRLRLRLGRGNWVHWGWAFVQDERLDVCSWVGSGLGLVARGRAPANLPFFSFPRLIGCRVMSMLSILVTVLGFLRCMVMLLGQLTIMYGTSGILSP